MPLLLLSLPIVSTLLGGVLAVRFRRSLGMLLALGAGLLLAAAFLDLLPEALEIGKTAGLGSASVLGLTLLSFLLFYGMEQGLHALGKQWQGRLRGRRLVRRTGALLLISHSFRDGMAIGAAFAASHSAGIAVAFGIAAHDLGDGMNTVILTTGGEEPTRTDYGFLLADAMAPFLGGLLTVWWKLSARGSVALLVLAAGFFLQMATGDFLPELRRTGNLRSRLLLVMLGVLIIYAANLVIARWH